MKRKITYLLLGLLAGCVQPFNFETEETEPLVVIEAALTDEFKHHEVSLTYSRPVNSNESTEISGASIRIESGSGTEYVFQESDSGYFSQQEFAAVSGESYQLIVAFDNKEYISSLQEAPAAPEIDQIYLRYLERPSEVLNRNEQGMQVLLDAMPSDNRYFRAKWEETFEVGVPFPSGLNYLGDGAFEVREESVATCFDSNVSEEIIVGNSISSTSGRLLEMPIQFVSLETEKLRSKYSILVTLHAISRETHEYFNSLREVNQSGGSLFDSQQGAVVGNVTSIQDEDETVLGYFEVAAVSSKRVFFTWEDLDVDVSRPNFRFACSANDIIETTPDLIASFMGPTRRLITVGTMPPSARIGPAECTDCTSFSSSKRPDFWE